MQVLCDYTHTHTKAKHNFVASLSPPLNIPPFPLPPSHLHFSEGVSIGVVQFRNMLCDAPQKLGPLPRLLLELALVGGVECS